MADSTGDAQVYTVDDLAKRPGVVIKEIHRSGIPAFITDQGRFVAVLSPLKPGEVEVQALAAMAREFAAERSQSE